MKGKENTWVLVNRIALGLVMVIPGLMKLFVTGPSNVTAFLTSLGFPAAVLFTWVLILGEILFGVAILAKFRMEYAVLGPSVILFVAAFTANMGNISSMLLHIVAVTNYLMIGYANK